MDGEIGRHSIANRERHLAGHQRLVPHLLRAAAIRQGDRVLDVGCGCGATSPSSTPPGSALTASGSVPPHGWSPPAAAEVPAAFLPVADPLDLRMPGMGGVEAITRLRGLRHPARVLILTTYDTDRDVLPAIAAGATGYLLKDAPRDELTRAVRAAHAGQSVLAPSVASALRGLAGGRSPDALSPREIEVLRLVADGATNQAAARQLLVSETTIKTHLLHIYTKLGVRDRAAAVAAAYKRGLLG